MRFRLGCDLSYEVLAETVLIFNVGVAFLQRHANLVDEIELQPESSPAVPDLRNRYSQVVAPIGELSLP
jgi:hypothetical protein